MFKVAFGLAGLVAGAAVGFLVAAWIGDESFAGGAYAGIIFGIPVGGLIGSAAGVWLGSRFESRRRMNPVMIWLILAALLIGALLYALREAIDRLI